ncbi:uncharacterized protein LOC144559628 [Carex rostrata]
MEKYYKPTSRSSETESSSQKKARVELSPSDIIADPGLRKPIDEYDNEIRDQVRRAYLLNGPTQQIGHTFPRKKQGDHFRSFQESWFKKFDWLEYSVENDSAYCFYCYLFKQPVRTDKFGYEIFTRQGFNNWRKALDAFKEHVGGVNSCHNNARRHCQDFKNQRQSVSHVFTSHSKEAEIAYRVRLTSILHVTRFLLLQALAFRGHNETSSSSNRGNFLELLSWYKEKNPEVAKVLYENAPGNNQMTSPLTQKEMVKACAQETSLVILDELGDKLFSVLVDESRDASIKEQMAVVVRLVTNTSSLITIIVSNILNFIVIVCRFVNQTGHVIERFLGIEHVSDTTASSLKVALEGLFARHGLSISRLRGQGYDGASNMRGEFNGLQRRILNENPYAFYIHCFAHQLQLVVVAVAKCSSYVADFFNYTTLIVNTVGASCKRRDQLLQDHHDRIVMKLESGDIFTGRGKNQETSLARPGDTRWGSHHTTLVRLFTMWDSVLKVLENVSDDATNQTQKTTAAGLIEKMESFEFAFIMHLMLKVLGCTNELSRALQRKDQNIVQAVNLIVVTKQNLQHMRDNGYDELLDGFCMKMEISVPNMDDKIPARGRSRRDGQMVKYSHRYHVDIFLVVLDSLLFEMNERFSEASTNLLKCIACLDPKDSFSKFDHDKLLELASIYSVDFSPFDCTFLRSELGTFISDVRNSTEFSACHDLATFAILMVQTERHLCYPLVYRLIELALILPVATTTVERAFSAMKIIKTELRNKMADEWMNDNMICYIEREIFAAIHDERILQRFQNMKTRKIQLSQISN